MRVNISALKGKRGASAPVNFQVDTLPDLSWGEGVEAVAPLIVEATVTNSGQYYLVRGDIRTTLKLECGRCLKPYIWQLAAPLEENYVHATESKSASEETEEGRQFAEENTFYGDTIDLTEAVREQAVLAVPYQRLCRENCAGLCPECGKDLNEGDCGCRRESLDPRLADLARFLRSPQNGSHDNI